MSASARSADSPEHRREATLVRSVERSARAGQAGSEAVIG